MSGKQKVKSEKWYQSEFLNYVENSELPSYLNGSRFHREVPLFYDMTDKPSTGEYTPKASVDFIEIDALGELHLWEAKKLHSYELTSGRVIGQLMFYDWLFKTYEREALKAILTKHRVSVDSIKSIREDTEVNFKSWNLLVCGGYGYEISAGINPVMWNYPTITEQYFQESVPALATYQFYHTEESMMLDNIWNMSIFDPQRMEANALLAFLNSEDNYLYDFVTDKEEIVLYEYSAQPSANKAAGLINREN